MLPLKMLLIFLGFARSTLSVGGPDVVKASSTNALYIHCMLLIYSLEPILLSLFVFSLCL